MKKRNLSLTLLFISIGINLLLSYVTISIIQSYDKIPTGTYTFSIDSDGDGDYEKYYLLLYSRSFEEYEIRLYTGSINPQTGSLCEDIEHGVYELEEDNYLIHTTSSENKSKYFFLTPDDIYFIKDNEVVICEKLADVVYKI